MINLKHVDTKKQFVFNDELFNVNRSFSSLLFNLINSSEFFFLNKTFSTDKGRNLGRN